MGYQDGRAQRVSGDPHSVLAFNVNCTINECSFDFGTCLSHTTIAVYCSPTSISNNEGNKELL